MCGICGTFNTLNQSANIEIIQQMNDAIIHRGPDSGNVTKVSEYCILGHRRLSIIDPTSRSDQPLQDSQQRSWIVYNGELYNYKKIQQILISKGYTFNTESDTEVILNAYLEFGPSCLNYFSGMYAFAIYSKDNHSLFIARDRLGIKPLYYSIKNGQFYFCSEILPFYKSKIIDSEIDQRALIGFLKYQYVPTDKTIFKDVQVLEPGHFITVEQDKINTPTCYWELKPQEPCSLSFEKASSHLKQLLENSVTSHLVSDVPFGAFLSGGLDSSIIVAIMSNHLKNKLLTFSVGFKNCDPKFNESIYAKQVAQTFNTDHHAIELDGVDGDLLDKVIIGMDNPYADFAAIPLYCLSQQASKKVKMVLTGSGGDEIMAGYRKYQALFFRRYLNNGPVKSLLPIIKKIVGKLPQSTNYSDPVRRIERLLKNSGENIEQIYSQWSGGFTETELENIFPNDFHESKLEQDLLRFKEASDLWRLQYGEVKNFLLGDGLDKDDRMGMHHGLELRVPFLDHDLVEFAFSLPDHYKMKGLSLKHILKHVANDYLPKTIIARKKQGFDVPMGQWFKSELKEYLTDTLNTSNNLYVKNFFSSEVINKLISDHLNGKKDNSHRLWELVVLERWNNILKTY